MLSVVNGFNNLVLLQQSILYYYIIHIYIILYIILLYVLSYYDQNHLKHFPIVEFLPPLLVMIHQQLNSGPRVWVWVPDDKQLWPPWTNIILQWWMDGDVNENYLRDNIRRTVMHPYSWQIFPELLVV